MNSYRVGEDRYYGNALHFYLNFPVSLNHFKVKS